MLLVSVSFAVFSTYAIKMIVEGNRKASIAEAKIIPNEPEIVKKVLIAQRNLAIGNIIKSTDIGWQDWPNIELPNSFIIDARGKEDQFYGSVVRASLIAGQPVTYDSIVDPMDRSFLSAVLEPGMRAISIPIDEAGGNTGLIFPGDYVDVILTETLNDKEYGTAPYKKSTTLLTKQKVIAVGRRLNEQEKGEIKPDTARTITLQTTPDNTQEIALAMELGRLTLTLRSLASTEASERSSNKPSTSMQENKKNAGKIRIIRGSLTSTMPNQ